MSEKTSMLIKELIATVSSGDWGTDTPSEKSANKVLCIRGADIPDLKIGGNGKMPVRFLKDKNFRERQLKENDFVVEVSGGSPTQSTGRGLLINSRILGIDGTPKICSNFCKRLSLKQDLVDPRYFYYFWSNNYNLREFFKWENGTTGIKNLDVSTYLESETISLPSLDVQRKIAAVLGTLDDKIEKNRKLNATLERMAQALFKSWFVDFEPFGVERKNVDGRQIPVELELMQIGQLNPTLETGKRPKGGASTSGVPSVGAESVKHLGDFDYSATKFVPEEFAAKMVRGKINGYEVLLYKDGGKPGTFMPHFSMFGEEFPYADFYINEHVFKLDAGSRERNVFLLFNLQTDINVHWFESCGAKAAVPGINQSNVFETWVFNPDQPKAKEYSATVLPMVTKILRNCRQNRTLAQLRDALLPKLMSGELDVDQVRID